MFSELSCIFCGNDSFKIEANGESINCTKCNKAQVLEKAQIAYEVKNDKFREEAMELRYECF